MAGDSDGNQSSPPTASDSATLPRHDPYAALRIGNFRVYVSGLILATIGEQMFEVALAWDVFQRTHNPLSLAWIGLVVAGALILLAIPAGHIADNFDRRYVVFLSQLGGAMAIAALGMAAHLGLSLSWFYLLLGCSASCRAVCTPARSALLPTLVPNGTFANAVSWNSSGFQVAAMVGPALGGFLIQLSSPGTYYISAVCALALGAAAILVRPVDGATRGKHRQRPDFQNLGAGIRFVGRVPIILATMTLDLFAVLLGGATYLLPIFASEILKVGSTGFGWLRAAPAIGAMAMAMIITHRPPMKRAGRAMLLAVAGFGVATIVFGLSKNFWLSMAMLFLTGALDNISVLVRHTLVQVLTPDAMRGRVSAVNNVFIGSSNELGGFESGVTARYLGTIPSVVLGGIGTILTVIAVAIIWPAVRQFGSLQDARTVNLDAVESDEPPPSRPEHIEATPP
jgi:MFS family permease